MQGDVPIRLSSTKFRDSPRFMSRSFSGMTSALVRMPRSRASLGESDLRPVRSGEGMVRKWPLSGEAPRASCSPASMSRGGGDPGTRGFSGGVSALGSICVGLTWASCTYMSGAALGEAASSIAAAACTKPVCPSSEELSSTLGDLTAKSMLGSPSASSRIRGRADMACSL